MKRTNIPIYIDLLFCLVIMPPIIMLVPVDRWIVHHTVFMLTLIVYLYGLYFVYRKARLPRLFMQRKFGHILLLMGILVVITLLLTQFPYPPEPNKLDPLIHKARQHLRSQTVWFFFLVVTGFSLSIELIFELFRQILSKQEIEAEKNRAELALYKAQINPHFLFNTLNALYGLVLTKSDKTESAFIKFSNILKYGSKQETVTLSMQLPPEINKDAALCLALKNTVKPEHSAVESNRIGLKSSTRNMERMGGKLVVFQTNTFFEVTLSFPVTAP